MKKLYVRKIKVTKSYSGQVKEPAFETSPIQLQSSFSELLTYAVLNGAKTMSYSETFLACLSGQCSLQYSCIVTFQIAYFQPDKGLLLLFSCFFIFTYLKCKTKKNPKLINYTKIEIHPLIQVLKALLCQKKKKQKQNKTK